MNGTFSKTRQLFCEALYTNECKILLQLFRNQLLFTLAYSWRSHIFSCLYVQIVPERIFPEGVHQSVILEIPKQLLASLSVLNCFQIHTFMRFTRTHAFDMFLIYPTGKKKKKCKTKIDI